MYTKYTKAIAACLTGCIMLTMNTGIALAEEAVQEPEATAVEPTTNETTNISDTNEIQSTESVEVAGAGITVLLNNYYEQTENPEMDILALLEQEVPPVEEETTISEQESKREEYFGKIAIAVVDSYVNVRKKASTESKIVGKIYGHCGATIIDEKDGWYKITSGNVEGYIKSEYFVTGEEAEKYALEMGYILATVNVPGLNLRDGQGEDAKRLMVLSEGSNYAVLKYGDGWAKLAIDEDTTGWVTMDYIDISANLENAVTLQEEAAELKKEQEEAEIEVETESQKEAESTIIQSQQSTKSTQKQTTTNNTTSNIKTSNNSTGSATGQSLVTYAKQFVGNPYVYGGSSLTNGTDCSGFTMSVYAHFGYYLNRSSSSQINNGTPVSLSELQPGDLVFYAPNGTISHVAIYIGNGQIIHASTASTGIIISSINYGSAPYSARRILN